MAGDRWTSAFNMIPSRLSALGAGGGTAGSIDLTFIRTLLVGDVDAPTGEAQPYAWVYLDSPGITEEYVASGRTKKGIVHAIVDLVRDCAQESGDRLVPYGDATRPGIIQMAATVADALDGIAWTNPGFVAARQTLDAVGSIGQNLWRAILKIDIELRYADSARRT